MPDQTTIGERTITLTDEQVNALFIELSMLPSDRRAQAEDARKAAARFPGSDFESAGQDYAKMLERRATLLDEVRTRLIRG